MKALILAAGQGKRLQPITDQIPKALVKLNGVTLLENLLNVISCFNIEEIGIVIGYKGEKIKEFVGSCWKGIPISYFENEDFQTTNNVFSLYKATNFCDDDMLLFECDIFFPIKVIKLLLEDDADCSIVVSPFNPKTMSGSIILKAENNKLRLILADQQKNLTINQNVFKTVNIYKFKKAFLKKYMSLIRWYVENMGTGSYYEKVLGQILYLQENDFNIVSLPENDWCEIDNIDDLNSASKRFRS